MIMNPTFNSPAFISPFDTEAMTSTVFSFPYSEKTEKDIKQEHTVTPWTDLIWPIPDEKLSNAITRSTLPDLGKPLISRTVLRRKLLSLRMRAIQHGIKLLSADEVLKEVKLRRGETDEEED